MNILVIEGGGMKGYIPAVAVQQSLQNIKFDMYVGSSVGGILAALYATGYNPGYVADIFPEMAEEGFKKRFWGRFTKGKYNANAMQDVLSKFIKPHLKLNEFDNIGLSTVIASESPAKNILLTKENCLYSLLTALRMTYAAPFYFGYYTFQGKTYADGGTGNSNLPLILTLVDLLKTKKIEENVNIYSVGTGNYYQKRDVSKFGGFREAIDFLGMSREQSEDTQIKLLSVIDCILPINHKHFDIDIKKKYDKLDKPEWGYYKEKGIELAEQINLWRKNCQI